MKTIKTFIFLLTIAAIFIGCKKDGNYPGGTVSPYIALFDLRDVYRGQDVKLDKNNMFGSDKIAGVVVSDHSGNNLPKGLLIIQDMRRLNQLRGIAVNIGDAAANYVPGDSVVIAVAGGVLKRENSILQITGLSEKNVTKIASGKAIPVNDVSIDKVLANPDKYESTLIVVLEGGFNPLPGSGAVLTGDKTLNDGFGDMILHTETGATFANDPCPFSANFYGIVFSAEDDNKKLYPQLRLRTSNDVVVLSSTIELKPVVITGFMSDVAGGDGNYEYIQLMATEDIDFAVTPYSLVVTNNANASTPTGYPANGWATGGMRTFKFNLTSGTANKGTFFYVGGSGKLINGSSSTSIAGSNWIRAFNYTTTAGDGFGNVTSGLLANSGNASGIAVFSGTTITAATKPVDVIFIATGGSLYTAGPPPVGYRIANTDFYKIKHPISLVDQPFYRSGSNTRNLIYNTADLGYFNMLGGEYSPSLGKWTKARVQNNVLLTKTSALTEIESPASTKLKL